jgi:hypothetical protein
VVGTQRGGCLERGGREQVGEKVAVEARVLRSCLAAVMCGSDVVI